MSDFYFQVDVLRGQMVRQLADNAEQAVWVLAEFAEQADLNDLAEHIIGKIEGDPAEVAAFYRQFADLIEKEWRI